MAFLPKCKLCSFVHASRVFGIEESSLKDTSRSSRCNMLPTPSGRSLSLLFPNHSRFISVHFPISDGSVTSALCFKFSRESFVHDPVASGSFTKRLFEAEKVCKFDHTSTFSGILVIWLWSSLNDSRFRSARASSASGPWSKLCEMSNVLSWSALFQNEKKEDRHEVGTSLMLSSIPSRRPIV